MLAPKPDFSTRATSLERLLKLLLTLKDGCKCFLTLACYSKERLSQHSELSQHKAKKKGDDKPGTRWGGKECGREEDTEEVGLDNWPSRLKCPHEFTQLPWQNGDAGGFAPTRGGEPEHARLALPYL